MIKLEHTDVYGLEAAIRGMRNPMNSWDMSDSYFRRTGTDDVFFVYQDVVIGEKDLNLMKRLIKGGTEHRKFLRMINVTVDITAPLYWWKEFDTYKVGTVANSCSTMHKIHAKEFTLGDFSCEHLKGDLSEKIPIGIFGTMIQTLNICRNKYLETKDKKYWWQMIQLLPSSYNQKRTVQLNYEVLLTQYHQRKGHKLDEWQEYCAWIESLPYMSEFIEATNAKEICKNCAYHYDNKCLMNIGVWRDDNYCSLWKNK
jgi:hypothetical protein